MSTEGLSGWARFVEEILDGRVYRHPYVRVGPTPTILRKYGLGPNDLAMTPGKIARIAKEHPEITRQIWRDLPRLLQDPAAIVPSAHRDGSIIPVLALNTSLGGLVLVPILPAAEVAFNVILSVYARPDGDSWLTRELYLSGKDRLSSYVRRGFAATLPKPGSASEDTIPSSPGSIPADGTTKPKRLILQLRKKSIES